MKAISRRNFIKTAFAGLVSLTVNKANFPITQLKDKVTLCVDENGNAILHGAELTSDVFGHASVKQGKVDVL